MGRSGYLYFNVAETKVETYEKDWFETYFREYKQKQNSKSINIILSIKYFPFTNFDLFHGRMGLFFP